MNDCPKKNEDISVEVHFSFAFSPQSACNPSPDIAGDPLEWSQPTAWKPVPLSLSSAGSASVCRGFSSAKYCTHAPGFPLTGLPAVDYSSPWLPLRDHWVKTYCKWSDEAGTSCLLQASLCMCVSVLPLEQYEAKERLNVMLTADSMQIAHTRLCQDSFICSDVTNNLWHFFSTFK